jgi:cyclophilin family peptidyl-prolyl cis-trans isomerase
MNRTTRSTLASIFAAAFLLGACNGGDTDTAADTSATADPQLAPPATPVPADTLTIDTAGPTVTHVATLSTTEGDIVIQLFGKDAPKAVENFVGLSKKDYYKGVACHRVIPGFMIQTGDPNSRDTTKRPLWGQGGESIFGKTFEDEIDPNSRAMKIGYVEGTVAMANAGSNTNGSQFFIVTSQGESHLNRMPNYTIFGRVVEGMDVAHKIEMTGGQGEQPLKPAYITGVTIKDAVL